MADRGSYKSSGVDIEAGDHAVELIAKHAQSTNRPEVLSSIGGFAGAFAARFKNYDDPVLLSATDGVGTKLAIAQTLDRHDTVGIDLVAMVVDDLVCHGAEPLFLLDYIACGTVVPDRIERIVAGIADGCRTAGCALLGGETAEHPGMMEPDAYDLAAFAVGVTERTAMWGPDKVQEGDAIIGIASSGLHANGYSLVRKLILEHDLDLTEPRNDLDGATLGDVLLEPTLIYAPALLSLASDDGFEIHAAAHVTGGGIVGNVPRVLPSGLEAVIDPGAWPRAPIFAFLQRTGTVGEDDMWKTFNLGLGMTTLLSEGRAEAAIKGLGERGFSAYRIGSVRRGDGGVVREVRST
ncbi:MAG: phosphoribosylformylglycinamidine cyclo-ligase [Actinomycetota bacterium]